MSIQELQMASDKALDKMRAMIKRRNEFEDNIKKSLPDDSESSRRILTDQILIYQEMTRSEWDATVVEHCAAIAALRAEFHRFLDQVRKEASHA